MVESQIHGLKEPLRDRLPRAFLRHLKKCQEQDKQCYDHQVQAGSAIDALHALGLLWSAMQTLRHGWRASLYRGLKDCFKHLVLVSLLERMAQLPDGFTYVDTHSGWGLYDLTAPQAAVHQNHLYGIVALPGSNF